MTFVTSTAPDLTYTLPFELSSAVTSTFATSTGWGDVSIGGLGFNLRPSQQWPYVRATEGVKKQQFDNSTEPGEQSLSSWWVRSQSDWSQGAGIQWYEPGVDEWSANRFETSYGVDVWTPGEFSLLHKAEVVGTPAASTVHLASHTVTGVQGYVKVAGSSAEWFPASGSTVPLTLGGSSGTKPAVAGAYVYVGTDAGISRCDFSGAAVTTPWTYAGATRCWYVKQRLIVAIGPALYELGTTAAAGAITAVGTLIFTHPDSAWTWTGVAESGSSILASGYSGAQSEVVSFTIELNTLRVPELVGGSQVAAMPPGEQILCMGVYLGNVLVLGTSLGVRVGEVSADGEVRYGPLTVRTAGAVSDLAFRDRFAYVAASASGADGNSGAIRVDLSAQADEAERRAWAHDMPVPTAGTANSIALVGSRVVLAANSSVYLQSSTDFVDSGYLTFGRIRYRTVEPKAFRLARLEVAVEDGTASLVAITPGGTEVRVIEFTSAFSTDEDVTIQVPGELLHQHLAFKVTITPGTASPVVTGFAVKAAPAPGRVRLYQFPLSCFDFEMDRWSQRVGFEGGCYERLVALERVEELAAPIRVVDSRTGESFIGMIDSVEFQSTAPPDKSSSGFGGIAIVTIRRL